MRGRYADGMATLAWSFRNVFRLPCNRPFGNRVDDPPDATCPPIELLRGLQRLLLGRFLLLLQPLRGHFQRCVRCFAATAGTLRGCC